MTKFDDLEKLAKGYGDADMEIPGREVLALVQAIRAAREALEEIAVGASIATDGSGSAEEFEELYDFWWHIALNRKEKARDTLKRLDAILGEDKG